MRKYARHVKGSTSFTTRTCNRTHLSFCKPMAEDAAPDGALIVFVIFSTEISPLTGLAETLLKNQRQSSSAVWRGIFVVIKPIKSPAPSGATYSVYERDAPYNPATAVGSASAHYILDLGCNGSLRKFAAIRSTSGSACAKNCLNPRQR